MSLPAWLPEGSLSMGKGVSVQGGICQRGIAVRKTTRTETPPPTRTVKSGRYASHWNAFLLNKNITTSENISQNLLILTILFLLREADCPRVILNDFRSTDIFQNCTSSVLQTTMSKEGLMKPLHENRKWSGFMRRNCSSSGLWIPIGNWVQSVWIDSGFAWVWGIFTGCYF